MPEKRHAIRNIVDNNAFVLALFALLLNQNNSNKLQPGTLLCVHSHNNATSINFRAFYSFVRVILQKVVLQHTTVYHLISSWAARLLC